METAEIFIKNLFRRMQPTNCAELGDGAGVTTGQTGGFHITPQLVTIYEEAGMCSNSREEDAVDKCACSVLADGQQGELAREHHPNSKLQPNHANPKSGSLIHVISGTQPQPPPPPITIPSQKNTLTSPSTPLGTPLDIAGLSASSALRIPSLTSAPSANASPEALPSIAHLINPEGRMPANLHHRNSLPALLPSFGSLVSPQSTWRLPALSHSHSFHPYQRPLVHTDSSPGCRHPAEYPGGNAIPCATATVDAQSPHPIITAFDHQKVTGSQSNFYGCSLTTPNKGNPNGLNNLHQGVSKVSCFIAPNSQPPHVSRMPQQHPPHFKPIPSKLTVPSQPPQKLRNNHSPTAPFTFSGHLYSAHPHTAHPTFSSHHHIAIWSQPSPQRAFQQLRHQRSTVLTAVSPHSVARPPPTPHAASATISPDSTPRPYTCAICFKTFGRSNDLKRHVLTHTPDEKPYSCRWCGKKFSRPDSVRKHELSVVKGMKVRCAPAGVAGSSVEDGENA